MRQGYGEIEWQDKQCRYRGQWIDNLQSGIGILTFDFEDEPFLGLFANGVFVQRFEVKQSQGLLDRLDEMQAQMIEELDKLRQQT